MPHNNNSKVIENKEFVNENFHSEFYQEVSNIFYDIFPGPYHRDQYSGLSSAQYASIPRIGEWTSEVVNLMKNFDHCVQGMLAPVTGIFCTFEEEQYNSLYGKMLKNTIFNRKKLNIKFKDILQKINNNEQNIIIDDNEDFIYLDEQAEPYDYVSMEKIADPKEINMLQLMNYYGNKILKEEINTISRIIQAYKNDKNPDHFQCILRDNMLGCKRIKNIAYVICKFLGSEEFYYKELEEAREKSLEEEYNKRKIQKSHERGLEESSKEILKGINNSINRFIECVKSGMKNIDKFITQYRLEN